MMRAFFCFFFFDVCCRYYCLGMRKRPRCYSGQGPIRRYVGGIVFDDVQSGFGDFVFITRKSFNFSLIAKKNSFSGYLEYITGGG